MLEILWVVVWHTKIKYKQFYPFLFFLQGVGGQWIDAVGVWYGRSHQNTTYAWTRQCVYDVITIPIDYECKHVDRLVVPQHSPLGSILHIRFKVGEHLAFQSEIDHRHKDSVKKEDHDEISDANKSSIACCDDLRLGQAIRIDLNRSQ